MRARVRTAHQIGTVLERASGNRWNSGKHGGNQQEAWFGQHDRRTAHFPAPCRVDDDDPVPKSDSQQTRFAKILRRQYAPSAVLDDRKQDQVGTWFRKNKKAVRTRRPGWELHTSSARRRLKSCCPACPSVDLRNGRVRTPGRKKRLRRGAHLK